MKTLALIFVLSAVTAAVAVDESPFAALVTKPGSGVIGYQIVGAAEANVTEKDVHLIGAKAVEPLPQVAVARTEAQPLPAGEPAKTTGAVSAEKIPNPQPKGWEEPAIPERALRDSGGQILLPSRSRVELTKRGDDGLRNPWGIRIAPASSITDYEMSFGGIVIGPQPVALINGQTVVRGESVGIFTLAEIRRNEVVMAYDSTYFVIPQGRKIVVRIPKD